MTFHELFPLVNSQWLIVSLLGGIVSTFLCYKEKHKAALITLFFTAFILRMFMAHVDPFLHAWDERFHALVARNMMDDPFTPRLRKGLFIPYDYRAWCCNDIWLHKQPLFLWQMALAMKLFGVSEYVIRYPGALMSAISVLLIYRICFLMTENKKIAFLSALFTGFSYYNLQMIAGYQGMDHNDLAFDFYVLASFWAYAEYIQEKRLRWTILIGVLAGCAVLNKWLTGLIVFAGWGINILILIRKKEARTEILHYIIAITCCVIVFLPWQLYIFHAFPAEARHEFEFNALHLTTVVEGHDGDMGYYFYNRTDYFGRFVWYLLPVGMILLVALKKYRNALSRSMLLNFCVIVSFFSFIVRTKIYMYLMPAVPLGYLFMAIALYEIVKITRIDKFIFIPAALATVMLVFDLAKITNTHNPHNTDWQVYSYNDSLYRNLRELMPPDTKVVLNIKDWDDINVMFYNPGTIAYSYGLSEEDFKYVEEHKLKVAVFENHYGYNLPGYILDYPLTTIIHKEIK